MLNAEDLFSFLNKEQQITIYDLLDNLDSTDNKEEQLLFVRKQFNFNK